MYGTAGAAFEHKTLLGRILRASPDPRDDPKMKDLLKDSHRQPRNIVEGNINNLRLVLFAFFYMFFFISFPSLFLFAFSFFLLLFEFF